MATFRSTPALRRFRTPVRLRSWKMRPALPASMPAFPAGGRPGLAELVDADRHARLQTLRRRPLVLPPEDQPAVEAPRREPPLHDGAERALEREPARPPVLGDPPR